MQRHATSHRLHDLPAAGRNRLLRPGLTTALAALLAVLLAGCVAAPPVFEREPDNRLLALPDSAGIVVGAMLGFAEEEAMREEMVAALQRENVPAGTGRGNRASYRLDGWIDGDRVDLLLRDINGREIGRFNAPAGNEPRGIAAAVASEVADVVQAGGPASRTRMAADVPAVPVHVARVTGLGEEDGDRMARALGTALRGRGITVAREPQAEALRVTGEITVTPQGDELRHVKLVWRVLKPDGASVGSITQENTVPAAELAGGWGPIAPLVAEAAADGVAPVVERARTAD